MSLHEQYEVLPITPTTMEDLPMKPASSTAKMVKPPDKKTTVKRAQTPTTAKRPVKSLPTREQPRDNLGRFARGTGAVLLAGAKGTIKAVKGTAKAVKAVHRGVKRMQSNARKKAALRHRERNIALAEREHKLGLRKRKVRRDTKRRTR